MDRDIPQPESEAERLAKANSGHKTDGFADARLAKGHQGSTGAMELKGDLKNVLPDFLVDKSATPREGDKIAWLSKNQAPEYAPPGKKMPSLSGLIGTMDA